MKTAATVQRNQVGPETTKGGGTPRKPFFTALARSQGDEAVQARLRLGRPGDRFEVEADRVADRVVDGRGAEPGRPGVATSITPLAQRQTEDELAQSRAEDEKEVQAKDEEEEDELQGEPEEDLQRRAEDDEEEIQARAEGEEELRAQPEEEELQAQAEEEEELQARGEETEEVQAQPEEEEPEPVQARAEEEEEEDIAAGSGEDAQAQAEDEELQARGAKSGLSFSDEVARQIRASRGRGNPLSGPLRAKMEAQFGADLSGVRIHTDAPAILLAKALKAQAFTRGGDIFFNEGKFAPGSREGEHLLAHELTHTVQQGAVEPDPSPGSADIVQLAPENDDESYEVRPEIVEAIRLARGEVGRVNAKLAGGDRKRIGWERLREYFLTAFGGPVVPERVIDRITMIEKSDENGRKTRMDALPSWCGIFTWWAMKKAGIPLPDWKLGAPALDAMKPRPPGSLPRKGDIAIDVLPNNHFAMVTGLESIKDAEGKPVKLTRVATVNGNTAGEDNLGGQVQEKWDALSHWDHFLDPVGKMNLPEAPMVTVGREPGEAEGAPETPEAEAPTEAEAPASEFGPRPEVTALEEGVEAPPGDAPAAYPEPDLSLPPPAEPGPPEEVAAVEKARLAGSSDEATTAFIDASPSSMAASQPELGPAVDAKMKGEQSDLAENPPVLEAKTSGAVDAPITGADELPIPGGVQLDDGVTGKDPGAIGQVSEPAPDPFRGNAERNRELEKEQTGSFWDAFKNFLRKFTRGIRTRDGSIDTSAGERPGVALEGEADTARMDSQREEGTTALKAQRDAQTEAFRNHPGQSNIQPRKLDEQRPAPVPAEPAAEIEGQDDDAVRDFAEAPLPADVRAAADAKLAASLRPNLAEARSQTAQAASTRDSETQREIDTKRAAAADLNAETDAAQRKLVVDNRGKVAKLQGEGIGTAYEHVNAFARDAAGEQTAKRKAIGDHVKSEEKKAKEKLDQGEKDADKKKEEGERDAAAKKKELEKEQEKDSWWDRVKSAIKKAVKVITEAIDDIFTAVRKAVKDIIEKAKNAAIKFINDARNWVVNRLNDFRDWAKSQVDKYLKDAFPGLAKRINNGIDAVTDTAIKGVDAAADAAIAGIEKLANALAAALDKILATFQTALKAAVRIVGAVLQGDFAAALRIAIESACEIAGIDPKPVFDFLDRAGKAINSILKAPVKFIRDLFGAVGAGVSNFLANIKTHLIQGVIGWLTGALAEVNLSGPFEFTPRGILRIVLEILGLTYANIKARVIRRYPKSAKVFDLIEKGFALVKKLVTEGPMALWEEIKRRLSDLKETVMGAIRNWLTVTVIKEGVIWLLSLTNPASALVKAVKLLFDLVMFLVERYRQIKEFILTVYEAVSAIAAGSFGKVTKAVENALARVLPVLISLFASILGLGGIAKQVKKVIQTVTRPINKAIDAVVDRIVKFARKLIAKVKSAAGKVKKKAKAAIAKIADWWRERRKFRSKDGGSHSIYYKGAGKQAVLMVASGSPDRIEKFLSGKVADEEASEDQKRAAKEALAKYREILESEKRIEKLRVERKAVSTRDKAKYRAATSAVQSEIRKFRNRLDALKRVLERVTFDTMDDALVQTRVTHGVEGDKSAQALPLTYLPGNTKGSSPYQDPPGWSHAVALDTKPDGSRRNLWVRGHLLNDNLHGPGTASNLVPITQSMNREMETKVESSAKSAVQERGKLFFYKAVATFWNEAAPVDVFPREIKVTWGEARRDDNDSTIFKEDKVKASVPIRMPSAPPAEADAFVPSVNGGSPSLLHSAISKHDPAVTSYFVTNVLLEDFRKRGTFTRSSLRTRLSYEDAGDQSDEEPGVLAKKRQRYVEATYRALDAGDVRI